MLINPDFEAIKRLKSKLLPDESKKVLLYAPTFRKDKSTECYNIDFKTILSVLSEKFGGEWIIILRLHPHLLNSKLFKDVDNLVDMTRYDDIQELLMISDVLISDYSSLIFDFSLSHKPVFLYASDLDDYCRNDRSLYFDVTQLPFPIAKSNRELEYCIRSFDNGEYLKQLSSFEDQVGSYERGNASLIVSELIISKINS